MSEHLQHLPALSVRVECSHCLESVDHDGETHFCADCGIRFPRDIFSGEAGEYLDEEAPPCSIVSTLPVEEYDHKGRHWTITRAPCHLPEGHSSPHRYPETFESAPLG